MKKSLPWVWGLILILSPSLYSYDFKTFSSQIENTYEVQSALLQVKQIQNEILFLTDPEDINVSIHPGVNALTRENGSFGEEISLSGTASVKIPLGLSDHERERIDFAKNALVLAEAAVENARNKIFIKIYSLYQSLWLLQEEERIIKMEVLAAERSLELFTQRFALGNISLFDLSEADETVQEKNNNLLKNQLDQRITWFELRSLTFREGDSEALERLELSIEDLPKPSELYSWVIDNHPIIQFENMRIHQLEQTVKRLRSPDFAFSVKSSFNSTGNNYTANLNYDFIDPELSPSFSFPIYTFGEMSSSGGSSADTWNLGLTFALSLGSNKSDNLNSSVLETEILNARAKLDFLIESANLQLRSAYQQHLKDKETLEQTKRILDRSINNHKIVETKNELKQVSENVVLESESIVERSLWKIEAARINVEKSWLNLLDSAVWFNKVEIYE